MKFLLILLLVSSAPAKDLYQIRDLSEPEVVRTYTQLLREACHYADRDWKTVDSKSGYWGDGASIGNGGIRTIAGMVLASATVLKYDDTLSDDESRELAAKAIAALGYVTSTHVSGTKKCADGKNWGAAKKDNAASWQSGMWTGTLAWGAWLMWDKLDPELQRGVGRVVAWEDDILVDKKPRNNLWLDTKAEENGWEVPTLVLGELMFPSHPHAAAWHEAALGYMMNTLCTEDDVRDTKIVDGRPVNQWVGGPNLQPDFTLENHNIFHPSYVGCSSYFLTQAAMYCTYAGHPVPQAASHHAADTWRMFKTILLPWGEAAYPQGMDWELHGLPFINLFATLATRDRDPFAARMEQSNLQYLRAWQLAEGGSLVPPGSRLGIVRDSINAEQASYGLLAHKVFGPAAKELTASEAAGQEQGVREYPFVQFISHRTQEKYVSFSWKNKMMGLLVPIGTGHEGNPDFAVPIANGFVGSFELAPRGNATTTVVEHSWKKNADGFETTGTLLLNDGKLKQTLRLISIGSQTVVYEDRVTALVDLTVESERGAPIGIENDQITGGTRLLTDKNGPIKLDWRKPRPPIAVSGTWANVDGRIGVVTATGDGLKYVQASRYSPGISVYSDVLYGSYSDHPRQFKAGDEVARRVVIFLAEATPEETSVLAQSCRIDTNPNVQTLHFKQPDRTDVELHLLANAASAQSPPTEHLVREKYGAIIRGDQGVKKLALVFTGGDFGESTEPILDVLKQRQIKAGFFVTGNFLRQPPLRKLLQRAVNEGHYVGPHSDSHPLYAAWDERDKSLVTQQFFQSDLRKNIADLRAIGAIRAGQPVFFIPPYEQYNHDQATWSRAIDVTLINFTPGTGSNRDYAREDDPHFVAAQKIYDDILAYERKDPHGLDGFLLLLHLGSGRKDPFHPHLRPLCDELIKRGYTFERVDKLLQEK